MLGQLELNIQECEDAYDNIAQKIFIKKQARSLGSEKVAFLAGTNLYDHRPLEREVKRMVNDKFGHPETGMLDASTHPQKTSACKVYVYFCSAHGDELSI